MTTLYEMAQYARTHLIWGPYMVKYEVVDKDGVMLVMRGVTQSYYRRLYAEIAMSEANTRFPDRAPFRIKTVQAPS